MTAALDALHEIAKKVTAIHGGADVVVNTASTFSLIKFHADFEVLIGYVSVRAIEESTLVEPLMFGNGIHNIPLALSSNKKDFNARLF